MNQIKLSIQSKKNEVINFLEKLNAILCDNDFNADTDIILIRKKKKKEEEPFSTPYTLLDLDYDVSDVINRLKELTLEEYAETLIDKDDLNPPLLFCFRKRDQGKADIRESKGKREQEKTCIMRVIPLCQRKNVISIRLTDITELEWRMEVRQWKLIQ